MVDGADDNPWGLAYKKVMSKVRGPRAPQPTCPVLLKEVVTSLFPPQEESSRVCTQLKDNDEIRSVTVPEVLSTLARINDNKAPGPDGIPNVAFKAAVSSNPAVFANLYSLCLTEGIFPNRWKKQRLVLLLKPGKQPDQPSSYRPLCMLDTVGKVFERILSERLQEFLEGPGGLSEKQFGFRRARSTVDAIRMVVDLAKNSVNKLNGTRVAKKCAVITLDIKNAFNTANWANILNALSSFSVPRYLIRIIRSYLNQRVLQYDTEQGPKSYCVSGGVPQGSVLGPTLWNAMYDGILKIEMPANTTIVGYTDDIAQVVIDKHIDRLQHVCNDAITRIQRWLNTASLELAAQKTELVLISRSKQKEKLSISVGGHDIESQESIKYLGVYIDSRLTFKEHLAIVSVKATKVNNALMGMLPNIGGPQGARRKILSTVTDSIILYASPIWAGAKKSSFKEVLQVSRTSALRTACAYRTVSDDAICVIASKMPLNIRANEQKRLYYSQGPKPTEEVKQVERSTSIAEWQSKWDQSPKGRWTHRLIPRINEWICRKHGDVDFFLTQFLSGHGCFQKYLHRLDLAGSPYCPECLNEEETAEHVAFYCGRFAKERDDLANKTDACLTPNNLVPQMLESDEKWRAVQAFARRIIVELRNIDWRRRDDARRTQEQLPY